MIKTMFKMTMGLGILVLAAQEAAAQSNNCAPRDQVLERLTGKYGETRQSIGLGAQGVVVEVFASDDTGSWTIIATTPNGITCLVAAGQSFETQAGDIKPQGVRA